MIVKTNLMRKIVPKVVVCLVMMEMEYIIQIGCVTHILIVQTAQMRWNVLYVIVIPVLVVMVMKMKKIVIIRRVAHGMVV
jgi:hypothetical protein